MTIPKPLTDPIPEAWGFIVSLHGYDGFDRHDKYWFKTHSEMICFLCLGASEYLSSSDESPGALDEWNEKCKALDEKFLPTVEASMHGKDYIPRAMAEIANCFDSDERLAWWGQFRELMSGPQPFALKLRQQYFEDRVNPPSIVKGWEVERFTEWLAEFDGFIRP